MASIHFLGIAIWLYLRTPGVLRKDVGTASTAATVALSQLPLGTLGGTARVESSSVTAQKDATTCTQQTFQIQLFSMSKLERFNTNQAMVLTFSLVPLHYFILASQGILLSAHN